MNEYTIAYHPGGRKVEIKADSIKCNGGGAYFYTHDSSGDRAVMVGVANNFDCITVKAEDTKKAQDNGALLNAVSSPLDEMGKLVGGDLGLLKTVARVLSRAECHDDLLPSFESYIKDVTQ